MRNRFVIATAALLLVLGCSSSDPQRVQPKPDAGPDSPTASCEGVTCWSPPAPTCAQDGTLEVPAPGGYCVNGNCEYATRDQACSIGTCQSGQCSASACEGVTCNHPPITECASTDAVRVFAQLGTCAEGACAYATREQPCATGSCNDGVCGTSKCEGVYCDKPPARYCKDERTLLVFSPGGAVQLERRAG